ASCDTMGNTSSPVSDAESDAFEEFSTEDGVSEPDVSSSEEVCEYLVYVVDGTGNPVEDVNVLLSGGVFQAFTTTNSKGIAKFTVKKAEYKVEIDFSDKYYCVRNEYNLTEEESSVTFTLIKKNGVSGQLQAYSSSNDFVEYDYYEVNEGLYFAPVTGGEMTYFLFVPALPGTYEIYAEADTETEIGFYGSLFLVLQDTLYEPVDGKIKFDIHDYNIGSTKDTTTSYVIGVKAKNGGDTNCILHVDRTGEPSWSIEDEPWQDAVANEKYLVKYNGEKNKTLVNIDVLQEPVVVINQEDGYYHLGSEDGPLVLVRIDSDIDYLYASLADICDTSTFGAYFYDDDGNFEYRERYNDLVYQYKEICDDNGVCPLNPQLAEMIKNVGEYKQWWSSPESYDYIFGDKPVYQYQDYAWLFCCCYYR
ncbi:MAG: Ig-like domain-containing protein, partial [Clostridia bacterium]|nr:Ig-like domain-containing protein [Clostridia bacterium]